MSIFKEIPPTAGFPLYWRDFSRLFTVGSLEDDVKSYLGVDHARVTYSGTAALYLILETLKKISKKTTVVVPAYVCPLVPLAVKRAGLKVELCDIQKDNFDFDFDRLNRIVSGNPDVLAVVAVHLAGIPVDLSALKDAVAGRGIFIIEDCAQSLGAQYQGKKVGTLGDFSFFSLCRGKGLTIYEGGLAIAVKKEYAEILDKTMAELAGPNFLSEALKTLELFGYWIFYRPQMFWWVFSLPQIFWKSQGKRFKAAGEDYDIDFDTHAVSGFRKRVAHAAFHRLEPAIAGQRQKAGKYSEALAGINGIRMISERKGDRAAYPYLTVLFDDPFKRDQALKAFENSGLGVSQVYLCHLPDYDYLSGCFQATDCRQARSLAGRQLTLSTSVFLQEADMAKIVSILKHYE